MGFFDRLTQPQAPTFNPADAVTGDAPREAIVGTPGSGKMGVISLDKGQRISLAKTSEAITATCSWPSATDYDVFALVLYRDVHVETVATFGSDQDPHPSLSTRDGKVCHLGDVRRGDGSMATETVQITLTDEIVAVVPVVYSAQSNGTGSFRRYQVSMTIDSGSQRVVIDARNASDDDQVYSCVPGMVANVGGAVEVRALEQYSKRRSERRPVLNQALDVIMDAGPTNLYK